MKPRNSRKQMLLKAIRLAIWLFLAGVAMIIIGFYFAPDNIFRTIFHVLAGAVISVGLVETLHEWLVAGEIRDEFQVLADFVEKGIERVCAPEEIDDVGKDELFTTRSLKVLGMGNSWLFREPNRTQLEKLLKSGCKVSVLIPDPLAKEIIDRYHVDEPEGYTQGLPGLADRIRDWDKLQTIYKKLQVKVFTRYPVVNISIYDKKVFVNSILYKQFGKNAPTIIFRKSSEVAGVFIEHFDSMFNSDEVSHKIDKDYLRKVRAMYFPALQANVSSPGEADILAS